MKHEPSIITVGLSPAWDITCMGENPDWGRHINIHEQTIVPAGKALNVSKALAWMGQKSAATGLWGSYDYQQMKKIVQSLWPSIKVKMTIVAGSTRQNITVIDTAKNKEMHLRSPSRLVNQEALRKLKSDLQALVNKNSICVFAGAMPEKKILGDVIQII
jgi:1-phosphofructokinase